MNVGINSNFWREHKLNQGRMEIKGWGERWWIHCTFPPDHGKYIERRNHGKQQLHFPRIHFLSLKFCLGNRVTRLQRIKWLRGWSWFPAFSRKKMRLWAHSLSGHCCWKINTSKKFLPENMNKMLKNVEKFRDRRQLLWRYSWTFSKRLWFTCYSKEDEFPSQMGMLSPGVPSPHNKRDSNEVNNGKDRMCHKLSRKLIQSGEGILEPSRERPCTPLVDNSTP